MLDFKKVYDHHRIGRGVELIEAFKDTFLFRRPHLVLILFLLRFTSWKENTKYSYMSQNSQNSIDFIARAHIGIPFHRSDLGRYVMSASEKDACVMLVFHFCNYKHEGIKCLSASRAFELRRSMLAPEPTAT